MLFSSEPEFGKIGQRMFGGGFVCREQILDAVPVATIAERAVLRDAEQ